MRAGLLLGGLVLLSVHATGFTSGLQTPWPNPAAEAHGAYLHLAKQDGEETGRLWEQMSSEEREAIRARRKQYESMPPAERERIKHIHDRYQQLSPEERRELQEQWQQQRGDQPRSDRRSRGRD